MISIETNTANIAAELGSFDLWITCASFEDRWHNAIDANIEKLAANEIYIFYVEEYEHYSKDKREFIKSKVTTHEFLLSLRSPIVSANNIRYSLDQAVKNNKRNIAIDISTFTREALLILLKFITTYETNFDRIDFIYITAHVNEKLSEGVVDTRSIIGYSGDISISKPLHLIIMSGFEINRAKYIIENYEPDYISIGYGDKENSINEELRIKNEELSQNLKSSYPANQIFDFRFSLKNPSDTRHSIQEHLKYHEKLNANIVIAPLNNKISTIGAGMAAIDNENIQLCYSVPYKYNIEHYSTCHNTAYIIKYK